MLCKRRVLLPKNKNSKNLLELLSKVVGIDIAMGGAVFPHFRGAGLNKPWQQLYKVV